MMSSRCLIVFAVVAECIFAILVFRFTVGRGGGRECASTYTGEIGGIYTPEPRRDPTQAERDRPAMTYAEYFKQEWQKSETELRER